LNEKNGGGTFAEATTFGWAQISAKRGKAEHHSLESRKLDWRKEKRQISKGRTD